jgi:hypothetical protein
MQTAKSHLLLNLQLIVLLPKRMLPLTRTILFSPKFWPRIKLSFVVSNATPTTSLKQTTLADLADLVLHLPVPVKVNLVLPLLSSMISIAGLMVVATMKALSVGPKHRAIKMRQPWPTSLVEALMLVLLSAGVGP